MVKSFIVVLVIVALCSTTCLAQQAEKTYTGGTSTNEAGAGEMLIDITFLRPLGFAATILGTVAFVVSLPVTLITQQADKAAEKLIVDPGKYTFVRPLGDIE